MPFCIHSCGSLMKRFCVTTWNNTNEVLPICTGLQFGIDYHDYDDFLSISVHLYIYIYRFLFLYVGYADNRKYYDWVKLLIYIYLYIKLICSLKGSSRDKAFRVHGDTTLSSASVSPWTINALSWLLYFKADISQVYRDYYYYSLPSLGRSS